MSTPTLPTCKPNCGCQCNWDVQACREYDRGVAHAAAREKIIQDAYDLAYARHQREQNDNE